MRINHHNRKNNFENINLPKKDEMKENLNKVSKFLKGSDEGLFLEKGEMKSPNFINKKRGWNLTSTKCYLNNAEFYSNKENAITIDYGSDILLKEGGDIKFTSVQAPSACVASLAGLGAGLLSNGTYYYKITFVNETGETELGEISNAVTIVDNTTDGRVKLTNIPVSSSNSVIARKIYRTKVNGSNFYYLTTINDNRTTEYIDNTSDTGLKSTYADYLTNTTFGKLFVNNSIVLSLDYYNSKIGYNALRDNTTGYRNTAVGSYALTANTTGYRNTAVGNVALYSNVFGFYNTAVGQAALLNNIDGYNNTAIGVGAMQNNTTGDLNVAIGVLSLANSTNVICNTVVGTFAMYNNIKGSCVAIGYKALYNNTTGNYNIGIGLQYTLYNNTTGGYNIAIGHKTLYYNTTGNANIVIGHQAGFNTNPTSKAISSFEDYSSVVAGTVKATSTSHGLSTGDEIYISGTDNYNGTYTITVIDVDNFYFTATYVENETTGWWQIPGEGENNVFIGRDAGYSNTTGSNNVFLGYQAGYYETGSNKLYIANSSTTTPLIYGEFDNKNIGFSLKDFGSGVGVIAIADCTTAPTVAPTGGGILYVEAGALKYIGSSGTITTLAVA